MTKDMALPPLPEPVGLTPEYLERIAFNHRTDLVVPSGWQEELASFGWLFASSNNTFLFFERPGYWLRIHKFPSREEWSATVMPEDSRVPRPKLGDAGYWLRFPEEMLAPEYRGRGARAKALAAAKDLWLEHEGYLKTLGIELAGVGVKPFKGSGRGGYVSAKIFRRCELSEAA